ncbi:MAG: tRNA (adenosine(37)-N6)-dimethylallyltransferase MiaA [Candidatus Omnitrophica bacterium]|jgi:tRNA dimethylallyltransferase|nr:tRNA (adenosine(37)-N6)-dimethylallyltransferase MiaA [Candidatus Omnitrophota bacterium]MDD5080324.1 tRNA (adenosine(37)-N6)-dimethylallyltransferase MiaA [Candidatus Omnitrophota bacterium]
MRTKLIFLVGPTAAGKTDLAASLAKKINAEIISCDSMQVYKGMDILTSKPPAGIRKKVPHHLIDVVNPSCEYNVSRYRSQAMKMVCGIVKKGKTPFFVGGSGLYMSVMVDGIFEVKTEDRALRKILYKQAQKYGSRKLYADLLKADPQAAARIHPNDAKRIIRALEVFKVSGKPISRMQAERKGLSGEYDIRIFCLDMPREELDKRIDLRVDRMFRQGLVKEVKKLLKARLSRTAAMAIGIKEVKGYLNGEYGLQEAKTLIKKNTRKYARRQMTWFRKDKRIVWFTKAGTLLDLIGKPGRN